MIGFRQRSLDHSCWLLVPRLSFMLIDQLLKELSIALALNKLFKVNLGLHSLGLENPSWDHVVNWVCCSWWSQFSESHLSKVLVLDLTTRQKRIAILILVVAGVIHVLLPEILTISCRSVRFEIWCFLNSNNFCLLRWL